MVKKRITLDALFGSGIVFDRPVDSGMPGWRPHTPFAFFITEYLKPKIFVELGVRNGTSFNAFCLVVKKLGLETKCFGVDTWKGDPHTGFYNESVYTSLARHQQQSYPDISTLLKMTFDEALATFKDSSIDLLHIDGYHTYDAVRHDFTSWLPKMSRKGVVLLHDTLVREKDFGVWKFWEEISKKYPAVQLTHHFGLGVVVVGKESRDGLAWLTTPGAQQTWAEKLFMRLGDSFADEALVTEKESNLAKSAKKIDEISKETQAKDRAIAEKKDVIKASARTIAEKDRLINEAHGALAEREAVIAEKNGAIETFTRTIAEKDRLINEAHGALAERERTIAEKNGAIESGARTIAEKESLLNEAHAAITNRDHVITKKDSELRDVGAALEEKDRIVGERDGTIDEADRTIAEKERLLNEAHRTIADRDRTIAEKNGVLEACARTLAEKDRLLDEQAGRLIARDARIHTLSERLNAISEELAGKKLHFFGGNKNRRRIRPEEARRKPGIPYSIDRVNSAQTCGHDHVMQTIVGGSLIVEGWALDPSAKQPAVGVLVNIDGVPYNATYGLPRPDVARHHKAPHCEKSGFRAVIARSRLSAGEHVLTITVLSHDTRAYIDPTPGLKIEVLLTNTARHQSLWCRTRELLLGGTRREGRMRRIPMFGSDYERWAYRNRLSKKMASVMVEEAARFSRQVKFSVIIPVYRTEKKGLMRAIDSLSRQLYSQWEACIVDDGSRKGYITRILGRAAKNDGRIRYKTLRANTGIVAASNEAYRMSSGDYIILMDHDDELEPDALVQLAKYLQDHPDADIIYSDNDTIGTNEKPIADRLKPDWSWELAHGYCYMGHFKAFSRRVLEKVGFLDPRFTGSQDHELFLRAASVAAVDHIPAVLYHAHRTRNQFSRSARDRCINSGILAVKESLARKGVDWADVVQAPSARKNNTGVYALLPRGPLKEKISVIISFRNGVDLLRRCVDSVVAKSTHKNYEIILVDDESDCPETIAYLKKMSDAHRVLWLRRSEGDGFNFSKLNNRGAEAAAGDYLIFLNADTEVRTPDWLERMLMYCKMPEVGIVGAKLLYPDGRIQHNGITRRYYLGLPGNIQEDGPCARDCYAVTGACLMVSAAHFRALGRFDETTFGEAYQDVDLCLHSLQAGKRTVIDTGTVLLHIASSFRGRKPVQVKEWAAFTERWGRFVDPYTNPARVLFHDKTGFDLSRNGRMNLFMNTGRTIKLVSVGHNLNHEGAPLSKYFIDAHLASTKTWDITVFSLMDGPLRHKYEALGMRVIIADELFGIAHLRANKAEYFRLLTDRLAGYLRDNAIDMVYCNTMLTAFAIEAAFAAGIPSAWHIRESSTLFDYFKTLAFDWLTGAEIRRRILDSAIKANRLIFVSEATKKLSGQDDLYKTSTVIYNGIDLIEVEKAMAEDPARIREELGIPPGKKVVSIFGTVCDRKRQLDFVAAAAGILQQRNDVVFLIIGSLSLRPKYAETVIARAQNNQNIRFVGETNVPFKYCRISDICVCASANESFPRVTLEAMAFSIPLVTTPVFGIAEQVVDGQSGLFYKLGSITELIDRITRILGDPVLGRTLGSNARRMVEAFFDQRTTNERMDSLLRQVAYEDCNDL